MAEFLWIVIIGIWGMLGAFYLIDRQKKKHPHR